MMDWPELVEWMHEPKVEAVVARYTASGETPSEGLSKPVNEPEQGEPPGFEPGPPLGIIADTCDSTQ